MPSLRINAHAIALFLCIIPSQHNSIPSMCLKNNSVNDLAHLRYAYAVKPMLNIAIFNNTAYNQPTFCEKISQLVSLIQAVFIHSLKE